MVLAALSALALRASVLASFKEIVLTLTLGFLCVSDNKALSSIPVLRYFLLNFNSYRYTFDNTCDLPYINGM